MLAALVVGLLAGVSAQPASNVTAVGDAGLSAAELPRVLTVVSGYWQISGKHSAAEYAAWFNSSLRVDAPYVFYYGSGADGGPEADTQAEATLKAVSAIRGALPTSFVRRDIRSFRAYGSYDAGWTNAQHVPSVALALVWLEKVAMLADAAARVSGTDWFAWVDAGAAPYRNTAPPPVAWPDADHLATLPTNKVIYSGTRSSMHDFAGTAFMLHRSVISRLDAAFEVQRAICAARTRDWRCGSDQVIFTELRARIPTLFYKIAEGYGAVIEELYKKPAVLMPDAAYWGAACGTRVFKPVAVATLVSSPAYIESANVLWYSLRQHLEPSFLPLVDFIALLIAEHGETELNSTRAALLGWQTCVVPLIPPPFDGAVPFQRFREQFTKLALWNATVYERILYLDSDTLAVGNPQLLLTQRREPFGAVRDWENGEVRAHFNMGVASLAPNASEFARLDEARRTRRDYRMGMAEQGLLNSLYADTFKAWPFEYNGNLAAAAQAPTFWAAANASLRIIHYTWIKPFDPDAPRHRDYAACKEVLDRWLKARTDMVAGLGLNITSSLPTAPTGASVPVR